MPSPQATALTEAHRLAQARIGARTVQAMAGIWPLLDPRSIDASLSRWLRAALPVIQAQRATSARVAANYFQAFKAIELGTAQAPIVLAGAANNDALVTSLLVTGPYRLKQAMSVGVPLLNALSNAEASSAAAGMRITLNGGRETLTATAAADPQAKSWIRVASGSACAFCTELAGEPTVEDTFQAHDGCTCTAEPVFAN